MLRSLFMTHRAGGCAILAALLPVILVACDGSTPNALPPRATQGTTQDTTQGTTPSPTPAATAEIFAVFVQPSGIIRVRLATNEAPRVSMAFIAVAQRGYFTGRTWSDFSPVVRQTGESAPIFTVQRELSPKLLFDVGGRLCASNTSEEHTARSKPNRIFLTVKPQDRWNLLYSVFGVIVEGLDIATRLPAEEPILEVRIEGDTAALRARFAKELVEWNAAMDAAKISSVR